jgi:hypothetical protein
VLDTTMQQPPKTRAKAINVIAMLDNTFFTIILLP